MPVPGVPTFVDKAKLHIGILASGLLTRAQEQPAAADAIILFIFAIGTRMLTPQKLDRAIQASLWLPFQRQTTACTVRLLHRGCLPNGNRGLRAQCVAS